VHDGVADIILAAGILSSTLNNMVYTECDAQFSTVERHGDRQVIVETNKQKK